MASPDTDRILKEGKYYDQELFDAANQGRGGRSSEDCGRKKGGPNAAKNVVILWQ
jgi:hypothetical protein